MIQASERQRIISTRVAEWIAQRLEELAREHGDSLSNEIRLAVAEHLRAAELEGSAP